MSYFHGIPIMNNNQVDCVPKRKHKKQKHLSNMSDLKSSCDLKHRKRRSSTVKQSHADFEETRQKCCSSITSPKCKTARHLWKEVNKLVEENRSLAQKFEAADPKMREMEINEKDTLISKLRSKYQKLDRNYHELEAAYKNVNDALEECRSECKESNFRAQENAAIAAHLEKERERFVSNVNALKEENDQCNEDIALLKNVVYRLNVELERYQDKLRSSEHLLADNSSVYKNDDNRAAEMKTINESWGKVNVHALGPLLNAYTENLLEKEELIAQYKQEIDHFSGNFKEILLQNENLHKMVASLQAQCDQYSKEIKILEGDMTVIKEQNDLLLKQANLQKQKLQEIHSVYEQKVESMSDDNNKLHKEYLACKTELSNIKGKYEILCDGYEKLKNNCGKTMPVSVHVSAVDECKRLFEELKNQYDSEKRALLSRMKILEENHQENDKLTITLTAERDQLKLQVRMLEKNLKRATHKWEHLQNIVSSMQIYRDSLKRQLSKTTAFCEELVTEQEHLIAEKDRLFTLLKEREKETEDIHFLGNNITLRMGTLKSQLKDMQKGAEDQLASVEKQIKMHESTVGQMKTEHRRLQQIIRHKEEAIRKLQNEQFNTQDNLTLVLKTAANDEVKVKDVLKNAKIQHQNSNVL